MRNGCQRLTLRWMTIAVLVLMPAGCWTEPSTPPPTLKPLVLDSDTFVDSFLLTDDELHHWRFTHDQFVVEGYRQPLPDRLMDLLTVADSSDATATYRISGNWELLDNGHTLWLTEMDADRAMARPEVRLNLETKGAKTLAIEGLRYHLAPFIPHREVFPIRIYNAEVDEVIRGDLLKLRENDELRFVQLDGVICPARRQPFGEQAIVRCSELLGDAYVSVKVYRVDQQGRDIAHVWGPNYQFVNVKLLNDGLAWHDKRQSSDWVYATAEDEARAERRGLWGQDDPIPPWEFGDGQ